MGVGLVASAAARAAPERGYMCDHSDGSARLTDIRFCMLRAFVMLVVDGRRRQGRSVPVLITCSRDRAGF